MFILDLVAKKMFIIHESKLDFIFLSEPSAKSAKRFCESLNYDNFVEFFHLKKHPSCLDLYAEMCNLKWLQQLNNKKKQTDVLRELELDSEPQKLCLRFMTELLLY